MNRLVVFAVTVLAVSIAACSTDSPNSVPSGASAFDTEVLSGNTAPVTVHVEVNTDTSIHSFYVGNDAVDRTPTVTVQPQNVVVPNGTDNVDASFSVPGIAELDGDGAIVGDSTGTTVLTYTLTDVNHGRTTQSISIPITVVVGPPAPPAPRRVH